MVRTARALVIHPGKTLKEKSTSAQAALEKIARFGITTQFVTPDQQDLISELDAVPDVIILNASHASEKRRFARYASELRNQVGRTNLPVAIMGEAREFPHFDADIRLDMRTPAHVLAHKIKHAIRISTMKMEYERRLETATHLGCSPTAPQEIEDKKEINILVMGKGERYFLLADKFTANVKKPKKTKVKLSAVASFEMARDILEDKPFDCLVIDTVTTPITGIDDFRALKYNARFFNLPIIVLQEGLDEAAQKAFLDVGGCDLFDLAGAADEIALYAHSMIEAEHMRADLIDRFNAPAFDRFKDPLTGLPSASFFEAHLDGLFRQSAAWNRPVAFGIFDVYAMFDTASPTAKQRSDALMAEVGQMIASLLRVEDIVSYFDCGRFIVASPNTSGLSISILIGRIAAILQATHYAAGGEGGRVDVDSRYFTSDGKMTASDAMTRLTA